MPWAIPCDSVVFRMDPRVLRLFRRRTLGSRLHAEDHQKIILHFFLFSSPLDNFRDRFLSTAKSSEAGKGIKRGCIFNHCISNFPTEVGKRGLTIMQFVDKDGPRNDIVN